MAWESFVTSAEWALARSQQRGLYSTYHLSASVYLRILSRYPQSLKAETAIYSRHSFLHAFSVYDWTDNYLFIYLFTITFFGETEAGFEVWRMCPGPDWAQLRCSARRRVGRASNILLRLGPAGERGHGGGPWCEDRGDQKGVTSMQSWNTLTLNIKIIVCIY